MRFQRTPKIAAFHATNEAAMMTYDSGADSHYFSEYDRKKAGLPIIRRSTKRVGVANGGTSNGKYVTKLPFRNLSNQAAEADTFNDFPSSLLGRKSKNFNSVNMYLKRKLCNTPPVS